MKKIYLFILLLSCSLLQAQTTTTTTASGTLTTNSNIKNHDRYYNSWRFGINLGAIWETADVRSTPGFAGGFTLEKGFCENRTNFFSWALKGRALWGTAYGLDYKRNYDVKSNPALNGSYNKLIKYDSTSRYVYNNYRTQIAEGALELQLCFNRLRERTNILLNLWAGIGFTSYRVKTNLLDANNKMYNYYKVDSTGGAANIISSHKFLLDGSYESYATNSQNGNILTLSPSCGVGLGYRFNDYVSILWEYKLTFPQGIYADYMDGIKGSNNDPIGCSKDYYHYTCINFLFKIGGGHHKKTESVTNVNSYTPVNTNTYVNTNSVVTAQNVIQKPIVNITNPPYSPYNENTIASFTVDAKLYNVNHRNEVNITFNNSVITNYMWLGKFISFVAPLNIGSNVVTITAINEAGSDSKSAIINYNGIPPQITITTPGAGQHMTTQSMQDLNATVLNVGSASDISVKFNDAAFNSFGFNPADHSLYMQLPLLKGTNYVDITATNYFGNDFKSQIIIYNPTNAVVPSTVTQLRQVTVAITDPNVS
ncbi:MAG TPA: hypothetical protein VN026_03395, partial [Bacteroidia bacterium]|nr:hypothetical protein [Bacteroidia bacterium]